MLISQRSLTRSLVGAPQYFAGVFNKRKPTKKDLDNYDVVIIGCNLGGILSRQFDKIVHGHYKIMVVLDQNINQMTQIRNVYEQQKVAKTDYLLNAKLALNMYTAHSDNVGCTQIMPEENAIVLRNGRRIGYNHLVIAMGQQLNYQSIKGFEDAWQDFEHPVFTNLDHPSWRSSNHKYTKWHYNFNHGQAYFCIPPYPFSGEVESYNFLLSHRIWEWQTANGRQSPLKNLTIVNANDKFVQYNESGDTFFKEELKRRNIRVEYGYKLVEVKKDQQIAIFEDLKTGARQERPYNHLYQVAPTKSHDVLVNAGLTTQKGLLDVDHKTLRHNKYKNIFGVGDVNDVPTTNCFWAGFYQMSVVRNNLQRSLEGKSLNAEYDGYSKVPILLGQNTITYLCHKYGNENAWHNLYFNQGGLLAAFRYYAWAKGFKKTFMELYLEKNWGPPYYRTKQTFKKPDGEESDNFFSRLLAGKDKKAASH